MMVYKKSYYVENGTMLWKPRDEKQFRTHLIEALDSRGRLPIWITAKNLKFAENFLQDMINFKVFPCMVRRLRDIIDSSRQKYVFGHDDVVQGACIKIYR